MKPPSQLNTLILVAILALVALGGRIQASPAPAQAAPLPLAQADDGCNPDRSIQVSGAAVVYATPDRALLQLGVQSNARTPDAAQNANLQAVQAVTAAIKGLGIAANDVATDFYIVYPVYSDYSSLVIQGYRVDNTVSITVRDVSQVDDVLLATLRAGANEVQDVQFYTSELRKHRDQARELAMIAAKEKAAAIADSAGAQTGCVLTISENSWSQYYGSWRGGRQAALWAQNVVQNAPSEGVPLDDEAMVSLGQIVVRAEVSATYSLK